MAGDNHKNAIWALLISQLASDTDIQVQPTSCKPNTEQTFATSRVPPFETFLPLFKRTREDISVERGSGGSKLGHPLLNTSLILPFSCHCGFAFKRSF